jgi:radical SAM protein with 4Fe4S-binding SPASM domain
MYKIRRTKDGVQLFDTFDFYNTPNIGWTSWEIIKAVKKYGAEKAVQKIRSKFNITEKDAKRDIQTVLGNLQKAKINFDEIPSSVSNVKWAPRSVHFDITTSCNSNCVYCLAADLMESKVELPTEAILNLISQLPDLGTWLLILSGGEPLLRKDFFQILRHADDLGILTQVLTNGTLITKDVAKKFSKIKRLFFQISLDTHIPEHHNYHRGIPNAFEKTVQGIRNLKEQGMTPEIAMVISKYNYNDIEETVSFFHKEFGVKYIRIGPVSTSRGRGSKNKEKLELSIKQMRETGKKIIELGKKYENSLCFLPLREFTVFSVKPSTKTKLSRCGNSQSLVYISSDGIVYPCIGTSFPQYAIGDIKKDTLEHIWKTSSLLKKIRYLTTDDIKKCKTCKFKHLCTGGCRASSHKYFNTLTAHDPLYCAYFKV